MISNYNMYCQIISYISIYGTLITIKSIKHSLRLLLPLIYASCCLPCKTPAVVSEHIGKPFSTMPLFSLGSILMKPFTMFMGDGSHVFRQKDPNENTENEVSLTLYTPQHCIMILAPTQIHCNFPTFIA